MRRHSQRHDHERARVAHLERTEADAVRLVVYVAEPHVADRRSRVTALLEHARDQGIAGATVLAAFQGYGRHHEHEPTIRHRMDETPVSVVFVDEPAAIDRFRATIEDLMPNAVVTRGSVRTVTFHRRVPGPIPPDQDERLP